MKYLIIILLACCLSGCGGDVEKEIFDYKVREKVKQYQVDREALKRIMELE